MYKKVKGDSDLVRDTRSGAVINNNSQAYNAALRRKKLDTKVLKIENHLNNLQARISSMECSLDNMQKTMEILIKKLDK